jgi:adenylate cyclase, class 2
MAIETEKKYRLDKRRLVELTAKLREMEAVFSSESFEENYLHRGGLLDKRNAVLRLRKIGDTTYLTYKERMGSDGDFKHKVEHETTVADVDEMENIIAKLGYTLAVVYEKHRKTWHLGDCEIVLDELPFGVYMEIEGSVDAILGVEKLLGVEDLKAELRGYPSLTAKYGKNVKGVKEARFERATVV